MPLPCDKHGDPSWLLPENQVAWWVFQRLPVQTGYKEEKAVLFRVLDISVINTINTLCTWIDIENEGRLDIYEKLEVLYGELAEIPAGVD